jgi:folate-binding protein YgfZ
MMAQCGSRDRVFFDLSTRVKLRLSGADLLRFLNGQLTNDVRKASETMALEACVLSAKGKMDAHLFLHVNGDSLLLDGDPALQSTLQSRLERYIIADDVAIEDLTAQLSIFHVLGEPLPRISDTARVVSVDRFGLGGHDIWIDVAKREQVAGELSKTLGFCNESCAEIFRIEQGIPRWGRELTSEIIPVEADLEARCIDYEKGCYVGQEIISRMKMSGQRNKQLCGLISLDGVPLVPGVRLTVGAKDVGWITSATRSVDREIALGYVKRGFNSVGSKLQASSADNAAVPIEVVRFPFSGSRQP